MLRLAQVPGIIGIKEATGDIERACWLIKDAPAGFAIYSGDDATAVALMLLGGHGNVSVTANVAPRAMHELCVAAMAGRVREAAQIHMRLLALHRDLFVEPSPAPTKWALRAARPLRCGAAPADHAAVTDAGQAIVESRAGRGRPGLTPAAVARRPTFPERRPVSAPHPRPLRPASGSPSAPPRSPSAAAPRSARSSAASAWTTAPPRPARPPASTCRPT